MEYWDRRNARFSTPAFVPKIKQPPYFFSTIFARINIITLAHTIVGAPPMLNSIVDDYFLQDYDIHFTYGPFVIL